MAKQKTGAKKNNKELKVENYDLDFSQSEVVYCNLITFVKVSEEEAELFLCIKDPDSDVKGKVTHRLILTLPHLFRLREMLDRTADQIIKQMETNTKKIKK